MKSRAYPLFEEDSVVSEDSISGAIVMREMKSPFWKVLFNQSNKLPPQPYCQMSITCLNNLITPNNLTPIRQS